MIGKIIKKFYKLVFNEDTQTLYKGLLIDQNNKLTKRACAVTYRRGFNSNRYP
jgi:hypothetical protein